MGGRRYCLLADADSALGLAAKGVDALMRRNPDLFGATATVLLEGPDALLVSRLRVQLETDAASVSSSHGGARRLRLLTERGMAKAWMLTAEGSDRVVALAIEAVDQHLVAARSLRDNRGDAGLSLVAPWETPDYLLREERMIDQPERRLRLAEVREDNRREQARLRENRRLDKLRRARR